MSAAGLNDGDQTMESILDSIRRLRAEDHAPLPPVVSAPADEIRPPRVETASQVEASFHEEVNSQEELNSQEQAGSEMETSSIDEDIRALRVALTEIRAETASLQDQAPIFPQDEVYQANWPETDTAGDAPVFVSQEEPPALVSLDVEQAVRQSFLGLSHTAATQEVHPEEITERLLRPMLQQWLDDNLPTLVENLVREEISRLSGRRG